LEEGVINFEKMLLLGSRIQEVQSIVAVPYSTLQVDISLKHFLLNLKPWDEEELYSQSLVCEPLRGASVLTAIPEEEVGVVPVALNSLLIIFIQEESNEASSVANDDQISVQSFASGSSGSGILHRPAANPNDITTWGVQEVMFWLERYEYISVCVCICFNVRLN